MPRKRTYQNGGNSLLEIVYRLINPSCAMRVVAQVQISHAQFRVEIQSLLRLQFSLASPAGLKIGARQRAMGLGRSWRLCNTVFVNADAVFPDVTVQRVGCAPNDDQSDHNRSRGCGARDATD